MKQKDEKRTKEFLPKQWTNAATVHPTMVSCIGILLFNFLQRLLQSRNPFVSGLRLSFHPIQPICYLFLSLFSLSHTPSLLLKCDCFSFCAPLFSLKFLFTFPFFTQLHRCYSMFSHSFSFYPRSLSPTNSLNPVLFKSKFCPFHSSLPPIPLYAAIDEESLKGGWIFDSLDLVSIIQSHPFLHPSFLTHYYSHHSQPLVTHRTHKNHLKNRTLSPSLLPVSNLMCAEILAIRVLNVK